MQLSTPNSVFVHFLTSEGCGPGAVWKIMGGPGLSVQVLPTDSDFSVCSSSAEKQ